MRHLDTADLAWATAVLTQALAAHPALRYVCTGPLAARQRSWLLAQLMPLVLRHGSGYTNAEGTALALWLAPPSPLSIFHIWAWRWWPVAVWHLGWAGSRRLRRLWRAATWLRRQTLPGPHHLLLALAVLPAARRHGAGRRLLGATLALRQQPPLPSYVSAHTPEQLAFYQAQGFRLTGYCAVGGEPGAELGNWGLTRPAAGA